MLRFYTYPNVPNPSDTTSKKNKINTWIKTWMIFRVESSKYYKNKGSNWHWWFIVIEDPRKEPRY